jgi:N-acetylneuraminic acid mutarotase
MYLLSKDGVYMYDSSTDGWTQLASMQETRMEHGCGLVKLSDGAWEVVVAGGSDPYLNSVEIYNPQTDLWRYRLS